jgi:hypothetical protein
MASRRRQTEASVQSADAVPQAASENAWRDWPSPIRAKHWADKHGNQWRMRGGMLTARKASRLLRLSDVTVLHIYGPDPCPVTGPEREALIGRIEEFFAGDAPPMSDFAIAEFRNDQRQVMLIVQESC